MRPFTQSSNNTATWLRACYGAAALCAILLQSTAMAADADEVKQPKEVAEPKEGHLLELSIKGGEYQITVDSSESPDLTGWVEQKLAPVIKEWYPLIVQMLPSKDYEAPKKVEIKISDNISGVAYASGNKISCNGVWFKRQLNGEAAGAVVHELVHVVQQYRGGRRRRTPHWLVEGIPDYIRWFLYEPESKGALIGRNRAEEVKHDASYRTSANFIDWASRNYGASLIAKLNARLREGRYNDEFWEEYTGKAVTDLAEDWRASLKAEDAASEDEAEAEQNTLTEAEKKAGWQLLFDGKTLEGWKSFGQDSPLPGWKVMDGVLTCADPRNAGDLCTKENYEWFEFQFDCKLALASNSGVLFHVSPEGRTTWATGPELQLQDNLLAHDPTLCGWLYGLYKPPADPDTARPIDATLPAGVWNTVRLVVAPDGCVHEVNGVEYVRYELNSEEFNQRVAESKFSKMPGFAKTASGMLALQGDHGVVSFRNLKIRKIEK